MKEERRKKEEELLREVILGDQKRCAEKREELGVQFRLYDRESLTTLPKTQTEQIESGEMTVVQHLGYPFRPFSCSWVEKGLEKANLELPPAKNSEFLAGLCAAGVNRIVGLRTGKQPELTHTDLESIQILGPSKLSVKQSERPHLFLTGVIDGYPFQADANMWISSVKELFGTGLKIHVYNKDSMSPDEINALGGQTPPDNVLKIGYMKSFWPEGQAPSLDVYVSEPHFELLSPLTRLTGIENVWGQGKMHLFDLVPDVCQMLRGPTP